MTAAVSTSPGLNMWNLTDPTRPGLVSTVTPSKGGHMLDVVLLDFTDPTVPVVVDRFIDGTDTWVTWYCEGCLFTRDLSRGLDVLSFE